MGCGGAAAAHTAQRTAHLRVLPASRSPKGTWPAAARLLSVPACVACIMAPQKGTGGPPTPAATLLDNPLPTPSPSSDRRRLLEQHEQQPAGAPCRLCRRAGWGARVHLWWPGRLRLPRFHHRLRCGARQVRAGCVRWGQVWWSEGNCFACAGKGKQQAGPPLRPMLPRAHCQDASMPQRWHTALV